MKEKNTKQEKKTICIDCNIETSDFYKIQTNRGDVSKCKNCYELWIIRSTRYVAQPNQETDDTTNGGRGSFTGQSNN